MKRTAKPLNQIPDRAKIANKIQRSRLEIAMRMEYQKPEHIETILKNLPAKPGVYLLKNRRGKIIYVGKAKRCAIACAAISPP